MKSAGSRGPAPAGRPAWLLVPVLMLGLLPLRASADTLRLPTGEVLRGSIIEQTEAAIIFESKALGRLVVPAAGVEVVPESAAAAAPSVVSTSTRAVPAPVPAPAPAPAAPGPAEPQSWVRTALHLPPAFSGSVELGADILNADVKMRDYIFEASFQWKEGKNEYQSHHAYEQVTVNGFSATNTHDEGVRWIRHLNSRWMFLSQADWRHDETQGVKYRVDVIGIPAYYFVKTERFSLLGGVGPSYEWREWTTPGAVAFSRFNVAAYEVLRFQITKSLAFRQTFLGYVDPQDQDDYRYVFDLSLRQRMSAGLSLILNYNRRHDSRPAPRAVTDQDRLMTKLGYDF